MPLEPLTSALCGFLSDFLKGNQRGVVNPHALFGKVVEKYVGADPSSCLWGYRPGRVRTATQRARGNL